MGVQGLLTYIEKNPATRLRVRLGEIARGIREQTGKQALLLCDSSSVVSWLLKSYDCSQINRGTLSPYSVMYGGDFRSYGTRIAGFARAIKHLGIVPVFFVDGSPGSDVTEYTARFPGLKSHHDRAMEHCAMIQQVCDGNQDLLKVQWCQKEGVWRQVRAALVEDECTFVFCSGRATHDVLQLMRTDTSVCGVLSADTDFAIALKSRLFHVKFFDTEDDLGVSSETLCERPSNITCELVAPETLSRTLGIGKVELLADLAILCGNDYTAMLNARLLPWLSLGLGDCRIETVASWVRDQQHLLENNRDIYQLASHNPRYATAIQLSYSVYHQRRQVPEVSVSYFLPCESDALRRFVQISVKQGSMSSDLLSIVNGVYWRPIIHQPISLGQPCYSDFTLSLRKSLYTIMGMRKVKEFGRTSSRSFAEVVVDVESAHVDGMQIVACMRQSAPNEKLATLFHLMTNTRRLRTPGDIRGLLASASQDGLHLEDQLGEQLEEEGTQKAVLVCSVLVFMNLNNSQTKSRPSPSFRACELDALLVTCLSCVSQLPPCCLPDLPPARAVTVSAWFSHVLEQAYTLGSYLGLSQDSELPPPAEIFYPMAYVPFHVASFVTNEVDEAQKLASPHLAEAYRIFGAVLKFPSVLSLRAEIFNRWKIPNLLRLLRLFASAFRDVRSRKNYLVPRIRLAIDPPAELALSFVKGKTEEVDSTVLEDDTKNITEIDMEGSSWVDMHIREEETKLSSLMHDLDDSNSTEDCFEEIPATQEVLDLEECLLLASENQGEERVMDAGTSLPQGLPGAAELVCQTNTNTNNSVVMERQDSGDGDPPDSALSDISEDLTLPSELFATVSSSCDDRHELPVVKHRDRILELIDTYQVVCIQGETGCGKSTKVPQFILNRAQAAEPPEECRILVTQPRRVAAIKLAERVAGERCERVGKTVGYCIGGERHRSPCTALTYCTTGYMLQALVHNPDMLQKYSHIILDEIHERSTTADFTLLVVRKLVAESTNVKIIIMSATMQCTLLISYFEQVFGAERVSAPYFVGAKRYSVETYFIDQVDALAERQREYWHEAQLRSAMALKHLGDIRPEEKLKIALTAKPEVTQYAQDVCTQVIISQGERGESVLVFLPGISEISKYYERLVEELKEKNIAEFFSVFILHSQVPMDEQKGAFETPPKDRVHVILATNIAESSITLPNLRVVINFGIYRQLEYNSKGRMSYLVKRWCSHASCSQRAGRAGRVFEGVAVHLFTKRFYDVILSEYDPPEMLTAPIAKLVLQAKEIGAKVGICSPSDLLSLAIEPPSLEQLEAALKDLAELGAIASEPGREVSEEGEITLLGYFSLSLPVDLVLCRLILFGIFFGCPADAIVMAAAMSFSQDVFTLPSRLIIQEDRHFGESLWRSMVSRFRLDNGVYSDAITYCQLFREWISFRGTFSSAAKQPSRRFLARSFACQFAVRWERLLHLEASVSEIASRVLPHVPEGLKAYEDLARLTSLRSHKRDFFSAEARRGSGGSGGLAMDKIDIYFEDDFQILKSLLAAAFPHQLLLGVREYESFIPKERQRALLMMQIMGVSGFDPSRTVVMRGLQRPDVTVIRELVSHILPSAVCQINITHDTAFIEFLPSFLTNPKTALLRAQAESRGEATRGKTELPLTDESVVVSRLCTESYFFWQFGERRNAWRVEGLSVAFTKPRHPFSVTWYQFTPEQEEARILSWRNLTGLVCELQEDCGGAYLGVATTLQGSECRRFVTAKGITVLPSLRTGPTAVLMALAFQPLASKLELRVDAAEKEITAIRINSQAVEFPWCPLSSADVTRVNDLREALSKVLRSHCTGGVLPMEDTVPTLRPLLEEMLRRGGKGAACHQSEGPREKGENTSPDSRAGSGTASYQKKSRKPSAANWESTHPNCDTDSEFDSQSMLGDEELPLSSFTYYPPLLCSLVDSEALPFRAEALKTHCSFLPLDRSSDGSRPRAILRLTDSQTSSFARSNKLSPYAPEFVPYLSPAPSSGAKTQDCSTSFHSTCAKHTAPSTRPPSILSPPSLLSPSIQPPPSFQSLFTQSPRIQPPSTQPPLITHGTTGKNTSPRRVDAEYILEEEAAKRLLFKKQSLDSAASGSDFNLLMLRYTPGPAHGAPKKSPPGYSRANSLSSRPAPRCFDPSPKPPLQRIRDPSIATEAQLRKDFSSFEKHFSRSPLETRSSTKVHSPPHPLLPFAINPSDFPPLMSPPGHSKSKLSLKDQHKFSSVTKRGDSPRSSAHNAPVLNVTSCYPAIAVRSPSKGGTRAPVHAHTSPKVKSEGMHHSPSSSGNPTSIHRGSSSQLQPARSNHSVLASTQPAMVAATQPAMVTLTQPAMVTLTQPAMVASTQPSVLASTQPSPLASVQPVARPRMPGPCGPMMHPRAPPQARRVQSKYRSKVEPRFNGPKFVARYELPEWAKRMVDPVFLSPPPLRYFPPRRSPRPTPPSSPASPLHQVFQPQQLSPTGATTSAPTVLASAQPAVGVSQQVSESRILERQQLAEHFESYLNGCTGKTAPLCHLCGPEYLKFRQLHRIPLRGTPVLDCRFFLEHKGKFCVCTDARNKAVVKLLTQKRENLAIPNSDISRPTESLLPLPDQEHRKEVVPGEGRTQAVTPPTVDPEGLQRHRADGRMGTNTQQLETPLEVEVSRKPADTEGAKNKRDGVSRREMKNPGLQKEAVSVGSGPTVMGSESVVCTEASAAGKPDTWLCFEDGSDSVSQKPSCIMQGLQQHTAGCVRESTLDVEHAVEGGVSKQTDDITHDETALCVPDTTSHSSDRGATVQHSARPETPGSEPVSRESPAAPGTIPEGEVSQEDPMVAAATAGEGEDMLVLPPRLPSKDLASLEEWSSNIAKQWEERPPVQIPDGGPRVETAANAAIAVSESPFFSCESEPSSPAETDDSFADKGDEKDWEGPGSRALPETDALLTVLRDEEDTGWVESNCPVSREARSDRKDGGRCSRLQSVSSMTSSSSRDGKTTSSSPSKPGSTQHMLEWFTAYLSGKQKTPFRALCKAYRSTCKLTDEECWLEPGFFKRFSDVFATSVWRSNYYVGLVQSGKISQKKKKKKKEKKKRRGSISRVRRRSVSVTREPQEKVQFFKQYLSNHGYPEYRIGQLCERYRETHNSLTWINEQFFKEHSDVFTCRRVQDTWYIGLRETGGADDPLANLSEKPATEESSGSPRKDAASNGNQSRTQSESSKESLLAAGPSWNTVGVQKLESEIVAFLFRHNRMAFLSDLRKSKKVSWLSQMCNVCLSRKYFESRAHLFEVKEQDSFDECFPGGDCYVILTSEAAREAYISTSAEGEPQTPRQVEAAGKENESASEGGASPQRQGTGGSHSKQKVKKSKSSMQSDDEGYSRSSRPSSGGKGSESGSAAASSTGLELSSGTVQSGQFGRQQDDCDRPQANDERDRK